MRISPELPSIRATRRSETRRKFKTETMSSLAATSVASCSEDVARQTGRLAEKRGAFVRLQRDGGPTDEPEKTRLGTPHVLGFSKRAFRDVISFKKRRDAHPGSLEASGLLLLLKWITRSSKHHSKRVPILVDAQAILGAAAKGRSSARSINLDMKRIAVVTFSADLLAAYVYVPSEDNPADAPSRNVKTRKFGKRTGRPDVAKLPVKGKFVKKEPSNQANCLPWCFSRACGWARCGCRAPGGAR